VFKQSVSEFEGRLTGPLRTALFLLVAVALASAGLVFFGLLSRLRAARKEQQRLGEINAAREEFISIVSHELRTPATGQLGFLQTVLDHWERMTDHERRQAVSQAFANARRLHALTRDVLDTTSIEAGELPYVFEVTDLGPAIRAAVDAIQLSHDHQVAVDAVDQPFVVRADPDRLGQVMTNLLDNAAKNSPRGSTIEVHLNATDGEVVVEVCDRGLGMTPDEIARAFEKFTRARHGTVQGTGLGLYICKKIIDAHGGRIWASPRDGGGATLGFALPLASAATTSTPSVSRAGT
jgi:signal transduction histidine kinase